MKFLSTRGKAPALGFSQALVAGLASDGGLYVPEVLPRIRVSAKGKVPELRELGHSILGKFAAGDPLARRIPGICERAWDFPVPLKIMPEAPDGMLELFHGPTAAFKDFAARFLAECLAAIPSSRKRLVLVATSGDTGGAVASAFHGRPGVEVAILYPRGRISPRQEKQLTAWGGNVQAFAVQGSFDDCQNLVKSAFVDERLGSGYELLSANSINIGRILPQAIYYAWASLEFRARTGRVPGFVVPTGNLGNALAAIWAKRMGFPIREVALALNANRPIADFLSSGEWKAASAVATIANAMDVGNPSNMERLRALYPSHRELISEVRAESFGDGQIRDAIREAYTRWSVPLCPHTGAAYALARRAGGSDWIVVATAHPAKFERVVEPLIGREIPVPPQLSQILEKQGSSREIPVSLNALRTALIPS
ncbi:MAG TPA: threonine synthase [Bdellovibrionota bacterium]|nr:threonine synthase [Bdellovibrionota bacterium]